MNKEKIELLSKMVPIGGIFIILCSSIKLILFYSQFNISITDFLTIGEYATLFIDDILYYLAIFGLGIFLNELDPKSDKGTNDNLDYGIFKKERIGIILMSIVTVTGVIIWLYFTDSLYKKLDIIKVGIYLLSTFFYSYLLFIKTRLKFSYRALIIFAILFYTGMDGVIDAQKIKENKNKLNYIITLENETIITNEDLHYLGKSDKFIYLYFLTKKESMIFQTTNLMKIQIIEKKKNGS
ncbi:hypothetical protein ACQY1Q_09285 [Tenacibaculum sp. TC6]|uniref:hypothetical protein n=1 Tax=Tenacibaculum sp. TC6 TaxID=3423223 RepID=UPI003D368224